MIIIRVVSISSTIFLFLKMEHIVKREIHATFIHLEQIQEWDGAFLEDVLAEGEILYGDKDYRDVLLKEMELQPFQIIRYHAKNLNQSEKMKLKRVLYGYHTTKEYGDKRYEYRKEGMVEKLKGTRLGRGAFIIPEPKVPRLEEELRRFGVTYYKFRAWLQHP